MTKTKMWRVIPVLTLVAGMAQADEIVQQGSLSGGAGGPDSHDIVLNQFNDLGGSRILNFVRIDLLTSTVGGGTTTGTGVPVNVSVILSADYLLGAQPLAQTEAVIDLDLPNNGAPSPFSVFDTDTAEVLIDQAPDLAPWIGAGDITLTGITKFHITLTPPDEIDFSAGGTVNYTVTYDFQQVGNVPALPLSGMIVLVASVAALGGVVVRARRS